MNLKSHYKMINAIIIVVILVSSLGIYFYPHNDTQYYSKGKNIDLKYSPVCMCGVEYHCGKYPLSSYSVDNGKKSYLNSTLLGCRHNKFAKPEDNYHFSLNITTHNLKSNKINIILQDRKAYGFINYKNTEYCYNEKLGMIDVTAKNTGNINVVGLVYNFNATNCNINLEVSSGKLTNTYYITTQVQSAIYGQVDYPHTGTIDRVNGEFIIENENNSHMNIVDVHNGYYYYFVNRDSNYSFYYFNNSTLYPLHVYTNYRGAKGNYINTGNNTESICADFEHLSDFT